MTIAAESVCQKAIEMSAPAQAEPVIIVGAGISGLAAAAKISQARIPVIILEARDRIGGRILTQHDESAGFPIELGAEFIHGEPCGNIGATSEVQN